MDAMMINQQWSTRPDDQRFVDMMKLHDYNVNKMGRSLQKGVALDHLRLSAVEGNGLVLSDPSKNGNGAFMTHWSFGQLCQKVHAPAGYLRDLPAAIAAIPLQYSMEANKEDAKLLVRKDADDGARWTVDAVTSDTYGRVFDAELTKAIIEYIDLDTWKVPTASYASANPKRATTLYASDRDCFICLVDDQHPIEIPGHPEDTLFRGFIARNSEVGAAAIDIYLFLYRRICDNRIIHGLTDAKHLYIRHTSGGPMRFMREARPALAGYLQASTTDTVQAVKRAQDKLLGNTDAEVLTWLKNRGFTASDSRKTLEMAQNEPGNPRSVWSVVNGLTAMAHEVPFGDERLDWEKPRPKSWTWHFRA